MSMRALGPLGGSRLIESPNPSRLEGKPPGFPLDSADERRLSWSYGGPRSKRSGERSRGERDRLSGSYREYLEALNGKCQYNNNKKRRLGCGGDGGT